MSDTEIDVDIQMMRGVNKLTSLVGGLIEQRRQPPIVGLQSGYQETGMTPRACENAVVPNHCMRTVSQRSMSAPVNFLGLTAHVAAGGNVFVAAVTDPATGLLNGVGLGGTAPKIFHNANVQVERQRVDELVLWGGRAKVSVQVVAGVGGTTPFNVGEFVSTLKDFIRSYVVFRVFHTSDVGEPWISDTPIFYVDRPDGEFVPFPPVLWKDRDPKMELDVRVADFGAAAGQLPELSVTGIDLDVQASILFETLWQPDPEQCGNYWPGLSCPKNRVANTKGYIGR